MHIKTWGSWGSDIGQFITPHGIWVADGHVYVCDRENNRIQIFDTNGQYLKQWDDLAGPGDIYFTDDNLAYVVEQ